jgi:hypothetical protein
MRGFRGDHLNMSDRPPAHLNGPTARRIAPWLIAATGIVLLASWCVSNREPWYGPLCVLAGLAVGAQAVDGLRTGQLHGRFPNTWSIRANRSTEPIAFWIMVGLYSLLGATLAGFGLTMIAEWLRT